MVVLQGEAPIAQPVVHAADVAQGGGFAGAVADVAVDGQGLLEELQGPAPIPQSVVHVPDVVEDGGFAGAVADVAADGQGLLVVLQGAAPIPQRVVHAADIAQGGRLVPPAPVGPVHAQRLLVGHQRRPGPTRRARAHPGGRRRRRPGPSSRSRSAIAPRQRTVRYTATPDNPVTDSPGDIRRPAGDRQPMHLHPPGQDPAVSVDIGWRWGRGATWLERTGGGGAGPGVFVVAEQGPDQGS